ncbi:MAG: aspartate 1-decarboxylase, partial [Spirochaetes bacterium]|nr:aspartate 1-decarboxylase [Spirochaetota bacterium]
MLISMLRAKIHRAEITDANLHYEGSLTLDEDFLDASGLLEYEKI